MFKLLTTLAFFCGPILSAAEPAKDKLPVVENKTLRVRADLYVHGAGSSQGQTTPPIFLLRVEVENLTDDKVTLSKPTITSTAGNFRVDRWYEDFGKGQVWIGEEGSIAGQDWDGVLKAGEKKTIRVIGETGDDVKAGKEITATVALETLKFEFKVIVEKGLTYRCPCGCHRSEKMAGEIRKLDDSAARAAIDKALSSIAERENMRYITEQMIVHRLRLMQLAEEIESRDQ